MASTYTVNLGIEKIGTGEQSGTWGTTTNTNFDLIDQAINGAVTVTLASAGTSGSPNTLAITDGTVSDGRNKFIDFADGGDLGAAAYVQLTPNDAEKLVHIRNSLSGGRSIFVFQGTYNASNDFEIPNGKDVVLKFDGGGATATVTQVFEDLLVTAVAATTVDTTNIEVTNLKAKDGTSAGSIADSTGVVTLASSVLTTTDINGGSVDGVTLGTNSAVTEAQIDNININGNTISSTDTNGNVTITPNGTGSVAITKIDVAGGEIDGTAIGANSASTAVFTDLTASGTVSFSGATVSNGGTVTTINIDGGNIDGTVIGAASPAAGTFTTVTGTGFASTGDMTFGDNDKAIFGAGSDLQIYHDGSNSYIDEAGTGNLLIRADSLQLQRASGAQIFLAANTGAEVVLYHAGNAKLATTATGIDVTGTVTADVLTVDGGAYSEMYFDSNLAALSYEASTGDFRIYNGGLKRVLVASNGDISFYEDTGTTPKFFWDASAESLGIGTTSPSYKLDLKTTGSPSVRVRSDDAGGTATLLLESANTFSGTSQAYIKGIGTAASGLSQLSFGTAGSSGDTSATERMRIDSSGNVGIGTSSPSESLETTGNIQIKYAGVNTDPSGARYLYFNNTDTTLVAGQPLGGISWVNNDSSATAGEAAYVKAYATTNTGRAELRFGTGDQNAPAQAMVIDSSGNVGIGTTSPSTTLAIGSNATGGYNGGVLLNRGASTYNFYEASDGTNSVIFGLDNSISNAKIGTVNSYPVGFYTANAERMRIDSSGNLLVGKTSAGFANTGHELRGGGSYAAFTRDDGTPVLLNRKTSDGTIAEFMKDGTTVGSIGTTGGDLTIGTGITTLKYVDALDTIHPNGTGSGSDGNTSLGWSNNRFKDIYRSGSTISTSDRNAKQDERPLTDAEAAVAQACKGLLKAFRFIEAVETDGDGARIHFGIIAQDLQAAFEAEGLDANRYAMFRPSTFTNDEGNEQTRLGVCYENLLAFIIAAL